MFQYSSAPEDDNAQRFIGTLDPAPVGLGNFAQLGLRAFMGFDTSDSPDYVALNDFAMTLVLKSTEMTTSAVGLAIDEMADDSAELRQVTAEAKDSLGQLQDIRSVINLATAVVGLATAIASKNPGGAFNAAKDLRDALQTANA